MGQDSDITGKMRRAASRGQHARTDVGLLEIQPLGLPFGQQEDREGTKKTTQGRELSWRLLMLLVDLFPPSCLGGQAVGLIRYLSVALKGISLGKKELSS